MESQRFNAVAHIAAAAVSRRASLLALSGAGLAAAFAKPQRALAGKAGKKAAVKTLRNPRTYAGVGFHAVVAPPAA